MGLPNVSDICRTGRTLGLAGLGFAAEDFMASVGLSKLADRREVLLARSTIVNACRTYNIPSIIDMVSANVSQTTDGKSSEDESRKGRSLGFTGKQAIHPSQVETIQPEFGPSSEEVQRAAQVYVGDIDSQEQGKGVWNLNGQMIDAPVVKTALSLLDRASVCGIDVDNRISKVRLDAWERRLNSLL
ncbi:putative citrate lyase beta subunit [Fusarium sporotrichioides]|uniref:Putative citrate lyase beta subunit n=1 Tax=Fusarium sporotrichioides TaxID=5514 RepID=A0A395RRF6_FUSSP|nr:putative citrate lyase beta subunit [Fusarium sporotrichioides]